MISWWRYAAILSATVCFVIVMRSSYTFWWPLTLAKLTRPRQALSRPLKTCRRDRRRRSISSFFPLALFPDAADLRLDLCHYSYFSIMTIIQTRHIKRRSDKQHWHRPRAASTAAEGEAVMPPAGVIAPKTPNRAKRPQMHRRQSSFACARPQFRVQERCSWLKSQRLPAGSSTHRPAT